MNAATVTDGMGWIGAVALPAAYGMLCFRRLLGETAIYQTLNIFGSLLLVINTGFHGDYPSARVNVIWIAMAIVSRMHGNREGSA
jgi:hypothetical protein